MELFAAQGYENTTVAEIADQAEVAPRTVTGYFPSKLELATSFADEIAQRLTTALTDHPERTLLQNIDAWLTSETQNLDSELALLTHTMYEKNPELASASSAHLAHSTRAGTSALAQHLNLPADHPMVQIGISAIGATLGTHLTLTAQQGPSDQLHHSTMRFLEDILKALPAA
jgi:AcrR family transcriptional regulator